MRLDHQLAATLPSVWADPSMIEQVVVNLAINARDAMPEGGMISVETAPATELDLAGDGGEPRNRSWVRLRVSDTGVGMDQATLDHVFEPFFTTKPVGQGTGLGLATVYGIVQRHDGQIRISSQPHRGTTVTIDERVRLALDAELQGAGPLTG